MPGCSYLRSLHATAHVSLRPRAAGRQRRVSRVSPRQCQHRVPLLLDDLPPDLRAEVHVADECDGVQAQRQEE